MRSGLAVDLLKAQTTSAAPAVLLHADLRPSAQPYLAKCFAGLHQLQITEEVGHSPEIVAMVSIQGERVPFVKPLRVSREAAVG